MKCTALVLPLLATVLAAQTPCHAEFDDNVFADTWNSSAVTMCIKVKASKTMVIQAVQVFTGEQIGVSSVGIWSHNTTKDEPAQEVGRGAYYQSRTNSWQGANLNKAVVITSGQTFWVSWIPVARSQTSAKAWGRNLPGAQTYKWSPTNSAPWRGPFVGFQWKFRLHCTRLHTGVDRVGTGCKDSNGSIATYNASAAAKVGGAFDLVGNGIPHQAATLLVLGLQKNFTSIDLTAVGAPGCFLHTDEVVLAPRPLGGGATGTSTSWMLLRYRFPNDPKLKGFFFRTQLFIADPNLKRPINAVFTNGLGITIQ